MAPPPASLSLDLDNLWSYLKIHGDPGWESFPSYLDVVVPRVLAFLADRGLRITVFVVGQDAAREENRQALASLAAAGHEIGLDLVSPALGRLYFNTALRLCRLTGVQPSILLHPLDFLGCDDTEALSFFPAMRRPSAWKLARVSEHLAALVKRFAVVPLGEHAGRLERSARLREREPVFAG